MHWSYVFLALTHRYFDDLTQDCSTSIANTQELQQVQAKPSNYGHDILLQMFQTDEGWVPFFPTFHTHED